MKLIGLDDKEYTISLSKYINKPKVKNKSNLHIIAREILRQLFPLDKIAEEVYLPGCSTALYVDFLIASKKLACEVQGSQHTRHIRHFHKSKMDFAKAKARDREKREILELNNITLVELNYDDIGGWERAIINRYRKPSDGPSADQST